MICPDCRGRGVVRKRLIFFTWRHKCWTCGGTGQVGAARMRDDDDRFMDRRDDSWRDRTPDDRTVERAEREPFDVGSGGRSGGAGGGASWDADAGSSATSERDQPVIVDPFAAESAAAAEAGDAAADASDASDTSDAGSDSGSSDAGSTSDDSGTTY